MLKPMAKHMADDVKKRRKSFFKSRKKQNKSELLKVTVNQKSAFFFKSIKKWVRMSTPFNK